MASETLRRLREGEAAATPGPWRASGRSVERPPKAEGEQYLWIAYSPIDSPADAEFIAAARDGVPALLDLVDRLTAALEELVSHHGACPHEEADRARALLAEVRE